MSLTVRTCLHKLALIHYIICKILWQDLSRWKISKPELLLWVIYNLLSNRTQHYRVVSSQVYWVFPRHLHSSTPLIPRPGAWTFGEGSMEAFNCLALKRSQDKSLNLPGSVKMILHNWKLYLPLSLEIQESTSRDTCHKWGQLAAGNQLNGGKGAECAYFKTQSSYDSGHVNLAALPGWRKASSWNIYFPFDTCETWL